MTTPLVRPVAHRITHVAIRFRGVIHSLPAPNRHHDIIRKIVTDDPTVDCVDGEEDDQGFLDETGAYLTRWQALRVARHTGQLRTDRQVYANRLFSENLW